MSGILPPNLLKKVQNERPCLEEEMRLAESMSMAVFLSLQQEQDQVVPLMQQTTLQRHDTENSKQIFPEKELRGHSHIHIHVPVRD
jgi:hypothetical protein